MKQLRGKTELTSSQECTVSEHIYVHMLGEFSVAVGKSDFSVIVKVNVLFYEERNILFVLRELLV